MNAPWKPLDASTRDPFHAYVSDPHSVEVLRAVVNDMGWPIEKVCLGGLRNAVQSLSIAASPNVLFVDLSESGDPLNDINSLAEVCEPGTVVISCGQVNDVRLYRDLIASGIQDYLLKPLDPDHLRDTIATAQAVFHAPRVEAVVDRPHITVSVVGARGGVGASTVATSLAWYLSEREKRLTSLLDLDVHFGTGALALDLEPGRGLTDAIENPGRIDGLFIERAMVRASDMLAILSAEAPVNQPILTDGAAYHHLQEELRGAFECNVVDIPRNVMIHHPHLLHDSGVIVLVTEFSLAAARDTIRLLAWFKSNAPQARILVVANKVQAGVQEIARKDFEQSIERKIDLLIPYDAKASSQAARLGKAVSDAARSTKLGQSLVQIGKLILSGDIGAPEPDAKPAKGKAAKTSVSDAAAKPSLSLAARLDGLKKLLPNRTKAPKAAKSDNKN
ncbi:pilus assembly protein CpaE [Sphingobium sufflavum]|uniref:AAA family ATPase n=1 Tax=Sphingobium sufflavum TaxID=1129547 RepID=UPI001F340B9F|nr:pilus assembly protein CpaE [Sphingobium sufflavum]MCE7795847.1 pilus assembly protein CpaE [Sphingobium sufflavum]